MSKIVFISVSQIKVMTALHLLKEAGINANVIDKMDSAHAGVFGHIEILISEDDQDQARAILTEAEILNED